MKIFGVPHKLRLTKGSTDSRPKCHLDIFSENKTMTFRLGDVETKLLAEELRNGKIQIQCSKLPEKNG